MKCKMLVQIVEKSQIAAAENQTLKECGGRESKMQMAMTRTAKQGVGIG